MEKRELICIGCPMGCPLTVTLDGGAVVTVQGNTCPRGDAYARREVTAPTRIVTTTVRVTGGTLPAEGRSRGVDSSCYENNFPKKLNFQRNLGKNQRGV